MSQINTNVPQKKHECAHKQTHAKQQQLCARDRFGCNAHTYNTLSLKRAPPVRSQTMASKLLAPDGKQSHCQYYPVHMADH